MLLLVFFCVKYSIKKPYQLFTWTHCSRYSLPDFRPKMQVRTFTIIGKKEMEQNCVFFCVRFDVLKQSENQNLFQKHTI